MRRPETSRKFRVPVIHGVCSREIPNGTSLIGEKVSAVRLLDFPRPIQPRLRTFFKGCTFNVRGQRGNMILAGNPEIWEKDLQIRVAVQRDSRGSYHALLVEDLLPKAAE